jgi:UDP-N-acetylglucosamine--N-acetylmuramyl-(pentapeptide) pyrophosphoryl-undecaprenol N-acetylglucosamine transferase
VRDEFFAIPPKAREEILTILITGGSQGSHTLNRAAEESWPLWDGFPVRLIHQTGPTPFEELAKRFRATGLSGDIQPFLRDMPAAFASADLVVSRAGAGALSELAAAGKPSILIPLPTASDNHQLRNAQAFEQGGAARLVPDAEWTGQRFVSEVSSLLKEPARLEKMSAAARAFARPDAARRAADVLESLVVSKGVSK